MLQQIFLKFEFTKLLSYLSNLLSYLLSFGNLTILLQVGNRDN